MARLCSIGKPAPGIRQKMPGAAAAKEQPAAPGRLAQAFSQLTQLLPMLAVALLLFSNTAWALSTERASARPNDSSQRIVIGGQPTRITWVGTVGASEQVTAITLELPVGSALTEGTYVKVQEMVMDDPTHPVRYDPSYSLEISAAQVYLEFEEPIRPNNQLYIEIFEICLPEVSGEYYITGSYTDGRGRSHDLAPQANPIEVVAMTRTQRLVNDIEDQPWVQAWNKVLFLRVFFNPAWFVASVPVLFSGWLRSLLLVLLGFPLAIPLGLGISFMRMSRFVVLRGVSSVWVNIIRGTPLFLQIYIAFFGMPLLGVRLDSYLLATLVLAVNSSAYLAEIFRAGIQSINKGQFEAANSLGMNGFQTMFYVIIPQTVRRVIPTMTSEFILLYKDTSLMAAVGVMEQMMFAKSLANTTANLTPYVVSAGYYLIITLPLTRVISTFEQRLAASEGRSAPPGDERKPKRVGLFKTIAPISAADAEPSRGITPEQHSSM